MVSEKSNYTGNGSGLYERTVEANSFIVQYQKNTNLKWDEEMAIEVVEFINGEYPTVMKYMSEEASRKEMENIRGCLQMIISGNINPITNEKDIIDLSSYITNEKERALVNNVMTMAMACTDASVDEPVNGQAAREKIGFSEEYLNMVRRLLVYERDMLVSSEYLDSTANTRFLIATTFEIINNTIPEGLYMPGFNIVDEENKDFLGFRYFVDNEKNTVYYPVVGLDGNTNYFEYVHNNDEFVKLNCSYDYADMYAVAGLISDKEYYQLTNKNMDFQVNPNIVECGLKTIVENQVHENMEEILGLSNTYGRRL